MPLELTRDIAFVFLLAERLAELVIARKNEAWSLARGGRESGAGHYKWMVALHSAMLLSLVAEWQMFPWDFPVGLTTVFGLVCVAAQGLRWWVIMTLGRQWNTKIIIIPGSSLVRRGPFRYLRHPNYLAVVIEMVFLPLFFGAVWTGVIFSALNVWMLRTRIAAENDALSLLSQSDHEKI